VKLSLIVKFTKVSEVSPCGEVANFNMVVDMGCYHFNDKNEQYDIRFY